MEVNINLVLIKIQQISDLIYQQKQSQALKQLTELLNELTTITEQLFVMKSQGLITFSETDYLKTLTEAMNALESRDDVLVADILNYDLTNQLEEINQQL